MRSWTALWTSCSRWSDSVSRTVTILGATGSIGTQALQVADQHPDEFEVVALAAGGQNLALLAEQTLAAVPEQLAVAHATAQEVREALAAAADQRGIPVPEVHISTGAEAITRLAGTGADVVLNGITGSVGLEPTLAALAAGSTLALANKESLIAGGPLVRAAQQRPDQIVPVESEHSAIAQCLRAGSPAEVRRLVLTASGGPFRGRSREDLAGVTSAEALAHPNFDMGPVVTTNSATMVNKVLEVIEAHLLFDVPIESVDVVVHPQQQVHSMVEFHDGSTIAQAGPPRMLVPIALGLSWPDRLSDIDTGCDWTQAQNWQFFPLDDETFPQVRLARQAVAAGPTHPAVYNAANEECVAAFHAGRLLFPQIVDTVAHVVDEHLGAPGELTVDHVHAAQTWARRRAHDLIGGA